MPRVSSTSPRPDLGQSLLSEVVRLLLAAGFVQVPEGKGSHEKWRHRVTGLQVTIPSKPLRHMANEILKQAGLPKAF
ncbi:type II toxin-antitoxin system HicA family toxin [Brevundimonas naejangsanensis]|uniref:Type II toxin-antitoxin system HicA family toxin n=1 Tax=Brevundimonas naejangsanensis TaxID=588932 RepID=A0A494RM51_9CAUL|nr:type II toxin-antitoxin system HicA family toxin [Brevundimonas naejangsanensis]